MFAVEAFIGFSYGATRAMVGPRHLRRGILLGVVTWGLIGAPFFFVAIGMALLVSALPHGGPPFVELFVPILIMYLGHILGGAIAGFEVEYYLLRMNRDVS